MTTHPDSITTLPGTLPGLLRRGAMITNAYFASPCPDVVLSGPTAYHEDGYDGLLCVTAECPDGADVKGLALDLTDPAGRDVAARWLAERLGLTVGATAPAWEWAIVDGRDVWTLDGRIVIDRTSGQNAIEALALACLSLATI